MMKTPASLILAMAAASILGCTRLTLQAPVASASAEGKTVQPTANPPAEPAGVRFAVALHREQASPQAVVATQANERNESEAAAVSQIAPAKAKDERPQARSVFFRADAPPAEIPPVLLSKEHQELCRVMVGDKMPPIELPQLGDGEEQRALSSFFGESATVVVFWKSDRRMALEQLDDVGADIVRPFGEEGVAAIGIAVGESAENAQAALEQAGAAFPNLLDTDGEAFAKVGRDKLPRTYLLDAQGTVLWFDIEYSHATRRELHQALRAVVGER